MDKVYKLLDIIKCQVETIAKQDEFITKLLNENLEKENYIRELSKDVINEHLDEHKDNKAKQQINYKIT